jgi:hypothetical protein
MEPPANPVRFTPLSWWGAYWVEEPTLQDVSQWNTSVVLPDDNQLEYFGTYPTPSGQAFGDWATDLGVGGRESCSLRRPGPTSS